MYMSVCQSVCMPVCMYVCTSVGPCQTGTVSVGDVSLYVQTGLEPGRQMGVLDGVLDPQLVSPSHRGVVEIGIQKKK